MKVALLGLGVMGHGMAGRILEHGHTLAVYNRTRARAADLEGRGARVAPTPRAAAEDAEVVVTMVSNDAALRQIAEGPDGLLAGLATGAVVLQMSTVGPDTTAWLANEAASLDASMVDGPVLGSKPEAGEGKLWVLAGAEVEALERARPVLDAVSQIVYHVGPIGQGTRLKLCANLVGGGVVAALSEGLALLEAVGIDPDVYIQVLKDSNLPNRLWVGRATIIANRDWEPRFSLENMAKDIAQAVAMGREYGLHLAQGEATHATLLRGAEAVGGDRDMAAAFEGVRRTQAGTRA
jgi:3-hydroxyisobutyrate dehydrogenase-like beta-hydroxyacid dehydrogenase